MKVNRTLHFDLERLDSFAHANTKVGNYYTEAALKDLNTLSVLASLSCLDLDHGIPVMHSFNVTISPRIFPPLLC